jgi:LuxR family maltose regulon positive regulatory protein
LSTKLYIPRTRPNLIPRPRLVQRLNEGLKRKLTLVSAPAGFGKTTVLSEWVLHSKLSVAWVSLDSGDNDPVRFFDYFIAALETLQAKVGGNARCMAGCFAGLPREVAGCPRARHHPDGLEPGGP